MAKRNAPSRIGKTKDITENYPVCPHCGNKGRLPDFIMDTSMPVQDCKSWLTRCMQCNKDWIVTLRVKLLFTYENSEVREFTTGDVKEYLLAWCSDAAERENDILEFPTAVFYKTAHHTAFIEYRNNKWNGGTVDEFIEFVHKYAESL